MRFWSRADRRGEAERPSRSAAPAPDSPPAPTDGSGGSEADGAAAVPGTPGSAASTAPEPERLPADETPFIGRKVELDLFRRKAGIAGTGVVAGGPQVLLIVGTSGTGKRELLREFRRQCDRRDPPCCAPVIDLGEPQEIDDVLSEIAHGLEPEPDVFQRFHKTLRAHRDAVAGKRTGLVQASEGLRTAGRAANDVVPTMATGALKGGTELIHHGLEKLEASQRARSVRDDFVSGLVELARRSSPVPPVLLLSDVDRWPDHPTVVWLRRSLLPKLAGTPVLVVLSAQTPEKVGDLASRAVVQRLDRFADVEAREYVERVLGVPLDTRLARDILADSDGFPERLGRYRAYFEQFPEAYGNETLSDDARAFAAGGSVLQFLTRSDSALPRQLLLYAAPLRWFNATLLRETVAAAGLVDTTEEGAPDAASGLLDPATRPPWIRSVGTGWGLDEPSRRRAFVDELRRLDPAAYRSVHRVGAEYHHARLLALERREDEPGEGSFFDYVPMATPTLRFENDEYVAELAELIYHSLALAPDRGFRFAAEQAAAALFYGEDAHAARLLDLGPELELPKRYDVYLRQLADFASAMNADQGNQALQILEQLEVAGAPSDLVAAVLSFLRGTVSVRLGFFEGEVLRHLERAERLFRGLSEPRPERALRMRFASLIWLARTRVRQDPASEAVTSDLDAAEQLAGELDEPELQPEVHRTRALVYQTRGDIDAARRECDEALSHLRRLGAPRDVARVLRDRAALLDQKGDTAGARRDLLSARELYKQLESSEGEAEAAVALMEVELRAGDLDGMKRLREEVLAIRPRDPGLRNSIALAYHRCKMYDEAIEEYDRALELDPRPLFWANRALTLWASERRLEAIADAERAFELAPTDIDLGLWLAELKRGIDDWVGAAKVAKRVSGIALEAARAEVTTGDPASTGVPPALSACVSRLLELLDSRAAAELLRHCVELFPADPELHFLLGMALREVPDGGRGADAALRRACELAARAEAASSVQARYLTARADLLAQTRRWEAAERVAHEAVEVCPADVEAHELLARIQRVGRRDLWERDDGEVWPFAVPIRIELAKDVMRWISNEVDLIERLLPELRARVDARSGVVLPMIAMRQQSELRKGTVRVLLHDVPRREFVVPAAHLAAETAERCRALSGEEAFPTTRPWDGEPASWVGEGSASDLLKAGIRVWDLSGVILATLERAVEEQLESFVGFAYTAALARERDLELSPEELGRLSALLSRLVAERTPIHDLETIVSELRRREPREEPAGYHGELKGRLGEPMAAPAGAEHYALGEPPSAAGDEGSVILVRTGDAGLDPLALRAMVDITVGVACTRLMVPHPALDLEIGADLPEGEYEVHLAGLPRVAGSLRRVPDEAPASARRMGVCRIPERDDDGAPSPERSIAVAVENAIWDDPGLLLPACAAMGLVERVLPRGRSGVMEPLHVWSRALREVAAQRVPLHGVGDLEAARRVVSTVHPALGERPGSLVERHESAPERPIPDNLPLGVRDHIEITAAGAIAVLRVRAHVRHARPEHLRVRLIAPDEASATLEDRTARQSEDLLLDYDSISNPALGSLVGHPARGGWTLHVQDLEPQTVGTLMSWSLEVEIGGDSAEAADSPEQTQTVVPEAPTPTGRMVEHVTYAERVAEELRSYAVTVRVGERLGETVGSGDGTGSGTGFLEHVAERFFLESGLRLGRGLRLETAPHALGALGWEIEINDLPRSYGTAPDDRPAEALSEELFGCLRGAADELLGVGWTERYLEHLSILSPPLVAAVRQRYTVEVVCWLFRRLVADGFSLRDDRILDCLLEFEPPVDDLAALWRHTRLRLRDSLSFRLGGESGRVQVVELGAEGEAELRESIVTETSVFAGYSATHAPALLRGLRTFVEQGPGGKPPVLVTAPDLRPHVGRIVAAQFPGVPVLARDELSPELETEVVGRIL